MIARCIGSPDRGLLPALMLTLAAWCFTGTARADEAAQPVPIPVPSEQAERYYRSGCVLWGVNRIWDLAVPAILLVSGVSVRLRDWARRLGWGWFGPTVAIFTLFYLVLMAVVDLPLAYYQGFLRQHAYGLSNQSIARWLDHRLKGLLVSLLMSVPVAMLAFGIIRRSPSRWWLHLGLLVIPLSLFGAFVQPVAVDPLFNHFGPMKDQVLEAKILAEARRAGIEGGRVYEVDKSQDTKAVNAYVTGLFGSKRIVLWDTLLDKLDDDQVLFVMGHEMGHYVLGHVAQGVIVAAILALLGLYLVKRFTDVMIERYGPRLGIERLSDVAAAPLLLIGIELATLALTPIGFAFSRHLEHEADRFALELTHANRAGALSFVRMQEENLSMPDPGLLDQIWRMTHPSLAERIQFCNSYRPWQTGAPQRYAGRLFTAESTPTQAGP